MPDYAVVYTLSLGSEKRHVFEGKILNVPEKVKQGEVSEALSASSYAVDFSEHGFFLANRKVHPVDKIPKGTTGDPKVINWEELSGVASVQMNIRVPGRERAAWELAATREFPHLRTDKAFRTWLRRTLGEAAGIGDPTAAQGPQNSA